MREQPFGITFSFQVSANHFLKQLFGLLFIQRSVSLQKCDDFKESAGVAQQVCALVQAMKLFNGFVVITPAEENNTD